MERCKLFDCYNINVSNFVRSSFFHVTHEKLLNFSIHRKKLYFVIHVRQFHEIRTLVLAEICSAWKLQEKIATLYAFGRNI